MTAWGSKSLRLSAIFLAVGAFASAGSAWAQDSEGAVRLTGSVQLAPQFEAFSLTIPESLRAHASLEDVVPVIEQPRVRTMEVAPDTASATALPWFERFTLAPSETFAVWAGAPREFQLQAGDRWGLTLGYSQGSRSAQDFDLQDFSAGAFFRFSDRVQLGGELRFTSPEEEIFGEEPEGEKQPELRFESAFRF